MPRRLSVAFVILSCLATPLEISAQNAVTVAGNVYHSEDSSPAVNVIITLSNDEHQIFATEATSDTGGFRFGRVKRAVYYLDVNADGYQPESLEVDLSMMSDKVVSIYLKPIAKDQAVPKGNSISAHELSLPAKARDLMESGKKKLYQEKDSARAVADFQQAVSLAPGYYEAYYQLGMAYANSGNRDDAEKSFRKSIEVSGGKYGEPEIAIGTLQLERKETAEGEKSIRRGLQLNPNLWLGHYELGKALFIRNHLVEAEQSAEQARSLAPAVPVIYRLLSNIHLQEKNYLALLRDIDEYIKLDPDSPAGVRAKELREQVQQKIASQKMEPASAKP